MAFGVLGAVVVYLLVGGRRGNLLGAAALGDIGMHFPDSDARFKGADSRVLLRHVMGLALERGYALGNVDVTLICEQPKIKPHRLAMREKLAEILALPLDRVSVKATTTEGMGFTGRGEGIAAPLRKCGQFPPLAAHLLSVGEETGKLDQMFLRVAEVYEADTKAAIRRLKPTSARG